MQKVSFIIGQIWPDLYVVWTLYPGFWGQGVHFLSQKSQNMILEKHSPKTSGKEKTLKVCEILRPVVFHR